MAQRAPLVVAVAALVVALLGSTSVGRAATAAVTSVVPYARTAGFAKIAGNAAKLNGHKATAGGLPGSIPVIGPSGKLPPSLGAVGPQGSKGDTGAKGDKGDPGTSGYQIVTATTATDLTTSKFVSVACPTGKKAVGGGGAYNLYGPEAVMSYPKDDGTGWNAYGDEVPTRTTNAWALVVWAVCVTVT